MDDIILARALHVLAVVIWIGGVAMATTVVLPAVRRGDLGEDRLQAFQAIEHRFVWQARTAVIVVGLTGLYMMWRLDLWDRFQAVTFWWMRDRATRHRLRLVASGALGASGAERRHNLGRGRGEPGMAVLLTIAECLAGSRRNARGDSA